MAQVHAWLNSYLATVCAEAEMPRVNAVALEMLAVPGLAAQYLASAWPTLVQGHLLLSDKHIRTALTAQLCTAFKIQHIQQADPLPPPLFEQLQAIKATLNTEFASNWTRINATCSFLLAVSEHPQVMDYFVNEDWLAALCDFYLGKNSPLKPPRTHTLGSNKYPAAFADGLALISKLFHSGPISKDARACLD